MAGKLPVNQIICGGALEVLKTLPAESISCSISSPPYWALRDYGVEGQLGLEKTFEEYISKLCDIYDEVKRVLRPDGTCFVNLGDTYWGGKGQSGRCDHNLEERVRSGRCMQRREYTLPTKHCPQDGKHDIVQAKSLCLIPQRFAIEMVNRGWILRNVIVWHKPNPMPSSASDRFTVDFEYVFFFVKSNKACYYVNPRKMRSSSTKKYDYIWIHKNNGLEVDYQPFSDRLCKGKKRLWNRRNLWEGRDYWFEPQYEPFLTESNAERPRMGQGQNTQYKQKRNETKRTNKNGGRHCSLQLSGRGDVYGALGRNKRCVWTIPTQAFPEAHFATFPEKLVEPMIKAGCPEFICTKCGKAREVIFEPSPEYAKKLGTWTEDTDKDLQLRANIGFAANTKKHSCTADYIKKGYTDCGCNAEWIPGVVLDPFRRLRDNLTGSRAA